MSLVSPLALIPARENGAGGPCRAGVAGQGGQHSCVAGLVTWLVLVLDEPGIDWSGRWQSSGGEGFERGGQEGVDVGCSHDGGHRGRRRADGDEHPRPDVQLAEEEPGGWPARRHVCWVASRNSSCNHNASVARSARLPVCVLRPLCRGGPSVTRQRCFIR